MGEGVARRKAGLLECGESGSGLRAYGGQGQRRSEGSEVEEAWPVGPRGGVLGALGRHSRSEERTALSSRSLGPRVHVNHPEVVTFRS